LATYLRSLDVRPDVLVGICIERSLEMVVGLLGILKAGAAYLPLDPAYPQERIAFLLNDSQAPLVLTQQALQESLGDHCGHSLCLDSQAHLLASYSVANPDVAVEAHH